LPQNFSGFSLNNFLQFFYYNYFVTFLFLCFFLCSVCFDRHAHGTRAREWEPSLPVGTTRPLLKKNGARLRGDKKKESLNSVGDRPDAGRPTGDRKFAPCSLGLSATSQQYFALKTNKHQSSANSQTNTLLIPPLPPLYPTSSNNICNSRLV
jgi:hypothetical protein